MDYDVGADHRFVPPDPMWYNTPVTNGGRIMKTIRVHLDDALARELDVLLQEGLFGTEEEAVRFALIELIRSREPALLERFHREDIAWALKQKKAAG